MELFGNILCDLHSLRVAIALDGFNPSLDKRSVHSTWAIMLLNYNITPWFTTKPYFIMLALLIPRKCSAIEDEINDILEPFIDEMLKSRHIGW